MTQKYIVDVNEQGQVVSQPVLYTEQPAPVITRTEIKSEEGFNWSGLLIWTGIGLALLVFVLCSIVIVKQQTVVILERLGKFVRVARAGFSFRIPFIDVKAGELDLRVQQMNVEVETKTQDDVFVRTNVSVQYFVNPENVFEAFYKLQEPEKQVSSYVFDVVRSEVPKMKLDDVFAKKEDIALAVKTNLSATMKDFGYTILQALVTDIKPDERVKESMNEINAQLRLKMAAEQKGEADKILVVKKAEAEAASKKLQGQGIADQRTAIINGLKASVANFQEAIKGTEASDVMNLVTITQYLDTLKEIGVSPNTHTIMLPHSPDGISQLKDQLNLLIAKK